MPTLCANQETFLISGDMRHFCTLPDLCFACNRLVLPRQIYSLGKIISVATENIYDGSYFVFL